MIIINSRQKIKDKKPKQKAKGRVLPGKNIFVKFDIEISFWKINLSLITDQLSFINLLIKRIF